MADYLSLHGFLIIEMYISNARHARAFENESQLRERFASLGVDLMKNGFRNLTEIRSRYKLPWLRAGPSLSDGAWHSSARSRVSVRQQSRTSARRQVYRINGQRPSPSIPGLVDAILEVSRQRKTILDQVRSALLSGNDVEGFRLARKRYKYGKGQK